MFPVVQFDKVHSFIWFEETMNFLEFFPIRPTLKSFNLSTIGSVETTHNKFGILKLMTHY